jgi:hypothetical protein
MHALLKRLAGGDRRSIGKVDEVVGQVLESAVLFEELINGMLVDDPLVRMRSADAVEKITRLKPEWLTPYKKILIRLAGDSKQQEVRWHMAQILPRLRLNPREKKSIVDILDSYLNDKSKIVVTFALQALTDFAVEDECLKPRVIGVLEEFTRTGSPAIKNRGRKLLKILNK